MGQLLPAIDLIPVPKTRTNDTFFGLIFSAHFMASTTWRPSGERGFSSRLTPMVNCKLFRHERMCGVSTVIHPSSLTDKYSPSLLTQGGILCASNTIQTNLISSFMVTIRDSRPTNLSISHRNVTARPRATLRTRRTTRFDLPSKISSTPASTNTSIWQESPVAGEIPFDKQ
jgi:hypothetical protein